MIYLEIDEDGNVVDLSEQFERWEEIPGWEGFYEVSDLGRIRSLGRFVRADRNGAVTTMRVRERITSPARGSVTLHRDGVSETFSVGSLVARAFIGGYRPGMVAIHLNGDPSDNRVDNLRWSHPGRRARC